MIKIMPIHQPQALSYPETHAVSGVEHSQNHDEASQEHEAVQQLAEREQGPQAREIHEAPSEPSMARQQLHPHWSLAFSPGLRLRFFEGKIIQMFVGRKRVNWLVKTHRPIVPSYDLSRLSTLFPQTGHW